MAIDNVPEYQDYVKHKYNSGSEKSTGRVVAVYRFDNESELMFDVRTDDGAIIYATPAKNWKTISVADIIE